MVLWTTALVFTTRARYFSPTSSRFLTHDLLQSKDSAPETLNRYIYALNNPLRFADVSGLAAKEIAQSEDRAFPGVVVQWTVELPWSPQHSWIHTFIRITPTNQQRYANDKRFLLDEQGQRFLTIGAGPGSPFWQYLVSDLNRSHDIEPHDSSILLPVGNTYATEDELIDELLRLDSYYKDNLDYDAFPRNTGDMRLLIADDSYNSNSYTAGLVEAAGLPRPSISGVLRVTGWDKPVPVQYFKP